MGRAESSKKLATRQTYSKYTPSLKSRKTEAENTFQSTMQTWGWWGILPRLSTLKRGA